MIDPGNSQEQKEVNEVVGAEQLERAKEPQQASSPQTDNGTEQAVPEEKQEGVDTTASADTPVRPGKKRVKKVRQVTEEELMPRPSLWPLVLALSVAVALGGFAFNLILLGVGVIMVIVSIIGWSLERR
ncbi:MAG: cytochrome c oxidase subunit 4 [Ktedonobacteraceae bacterium]|nr:cytochrome c oxidase subunit 4 [Ktedonobacteraceae bacterium]